MLLLSLWSCTQDDACIQPVGNFDDKPSTRSVAEVIAIAQNVIDGTQGQSSRSTVTLSERNVSVVRTRLSRSASVDTLIYAVNVGDQQGFVLVAATKNVTPILGYAEYGDFNSYETESNENFQFFLNKAVSYVENQSIIGINPIDTTIVIPRPAQRDTTRIFLDGTKRVTVEWGQRWPQNIFCPNKVAGCGPIAIAQIMTFTRPISKMQLTYSDRDVDSIDLNWDEIVKHKSSLLDNIPSQSLHCNNCSDIENHYNIARFVREVGNLMNACYNDINVTTVAATLSHLNRFHPNFEITYFRGNSFFSSLQNQNCVGFIIGFDNNIPDSGHVWVVDGTMTVITRIYNRESNGLKTLVSSSIEKYIHHNWGCLGWDNGYYLADVMKPNKDNDVPERGLSYPDFSQDIRCAIIKK